MLDSKVSRISDLCGGKADVEFAQALAKVVENINDPTYSKGAARRIRVDVILKPSSVESDKTTDVTIDVQTTLPRRAAKRSIAWIGKTKDGQGALFNDDPDQTKMFRDLAPEVPAKK